MSRHARRHINEPTPRTTAVGLQAATDTISKIAEVSRTLKSAILSLPLWGTLYRLMENRMRAKAISKVATSAPT
jgi:hypothetical protein